MTSDHNKPVYQRIYDTILKEIRSDKYMGDTRLPTDGQLMKRFKTSRMTVIRAMKELEREGIIVRHVGLGSFVNMVPPQKDNLLSLIIIGTSDLRFFEPIYNQIAEECFRLGLPLLWGFGSNAIVTDNVQASAICKRCIDQKVSGVFYAPSLPDPHGNPNINQKILQTLTRSGIKVVLLCRDIYEFPRRSNFDRVTINDLESGYLQAEHLLKKGCRRILYLSPTRTASLRIGRQEGYRMALDDAGIPFRPEWKLVGNTADLSFVKKALEFNPDGMICFNDYVAVPLLNHLRTLHIAVPEQIKVIGYDNIDYLDFADVALSTLAQPQKEMGIAAVHMMLERLRGNTLPPASMSFSAKLIERRSSH